LVTLGIISMMVGAFSMAFIVIRTEGPNIYQIYPAGSEIAPTPLEPGENVPLMIDITEDESGLDIDVWCEIDLGNDGTVDENKTGKALFSGYNSEYYYCWRDWYIIPQVPGMWIKFTFYARFRGTSLTSTEVGWAETGKPSGKFYINNTRIEKDLTYEFYTRTLRFTFEATQSATDISQVWVRIYDPTNNITWDKYLDKQNDIWWNNTSWTAPHDGTYEVTGYVEDKWGYRYTLMSVASDIGFPQPPTELPKYVVPLGLGLFGALLIVVGLTSFKK